MKKAILIGVLNVIIPGAGMAVLKQWKMALAYFIVIPVFLVVSPITIGLILGRILVTEGQDGMITPSFGYLGIAVYLLGMIAVVYDAFVTSYRLAKGEPLQFSPILVVALGAVFPGLGFIYLKKWGYAFWYAIWSPLAIVFGTILFTFIVAIPVNLIPWIANRGNVVVWLAETSVKLFVIWVNASHTREIALGMQSIQETPATNPA